MVLKPLEEKREATVRQSTSHSFAAARIKEQLEGRKGKTRINSSRNTTFGIWAGKWAEQQQLDSQENHN